MTTGLLHLVSVPPGAAASLDDQPVGRTPLTIKAPLGASHRLALQLRGFRPWRESVSLSTAAPERKLVAELIPAGRSSPGGKSRATGWVHLSTQPAYAEVFLGERRLDVTPCRIQLPVGSHLLRLVNRKLGLVVRRRVVVQTDKEARVVLDNFQ